MKKYIHITWLLALIAAPQLCFGQPLFNSIYDHDSTGDWGTNVFVKPDNSYLLMGGGAKQGNGWDAFWMDISQDGSQVLAKQYVQSTLTSYYIGGYGRTEKLQDGGYIIPHQFVKPGTGFDRYSSGLLKLDNQKNIVFAKYYTDTANCQEFTEDVTVLPDGGYIVAGGIDTPGIPRNDGLLLRMDSNGNLLWRKVYRKYPVNNYYGFFRSVQYIGNNTVFACARWGNYMTLGSFVYNRFAPWLMLLDLQGNIIKDTLLSQGYINNWGASRDVNGGFYHWGALDTFLTSDPENYQNLPGYLERLDDSFHVLWTKRFGNLDDHIAVMNVKQTQDGNYIAVGRGLMANEVGMQGWAAKLDKNGFVMWEHIYAAPHKNWNQAYLVDFAERPDKSIVMSGSTRSDTVDLWRAYDAWLLSVDSNGCEIPGCNPNAVEQPVYNEGAISVYPNPTTGEFTADAKDEGSGVISDLQGREIKRIHIVKGKNEMSLPVGLASGVYLLQYRTAHGNVNVRLIKE